MTTDVEARPPFFGYPHDSGSYGQHGDAVIGGVLYRLCAGCKLWKRPAGNWYCHIHGLLCGPCGEADVNMAHNWSVFQDEEPTV